LFGETCFTAQKLSFRSEVCFLRRGYFPGKIIKNDPFKNRHCHPQPVKINKLFILFNALKFFGGLYRNLTGYLLLAVAFFPVFSANCLILIIPAMPLLKS
jgi:hypothetical protein